MSRIKLVQGNNLPYIRLTLTDQATGSPINLSDGSVAVRVLFKAAGSDTVLSTITCEKVNGGATGIVRFNFANDELEVDPGMYEGEVELDFDGLIQTVYDVLKFGVRSR